jgi:putative endonuclease
MMKILFWKKTEKNVGQTGENTAVKYLKKKGYSILERNYKNKMGRQLGEIDIIAKMKDEIIFVEVKTRKMSGNGGSLPEENITYRKLERLNKIASSYIKTNNLWDFSFRFDAISIVIGKNDVFEIRHLENIFR